MKNNSQNQHHNNFSSNNSKNINKLEQLEDDSQNDKSIIDFDDEYSEVPNLYSKNQKNKINDNAQKLKIFEDDQYIYLDNSYSKIKTNTLKKQIINQNLKQLIDIDINDKKGVIDLLMQDDIIQKKDEEIIEKNNKYDYIEPKNKNECSINKKNTYGRIGFHIEPQEGDPEFIKDMNVAANIIKSQMQQKDENLAKLLFDDINLNKKLFMTRKEIGEKVEKALEKKRKNLEKIKAKINEKQKKKELCLNNNHNIHEKKSGHQRSLNLFLKGQRNFQKKVSMKNQKLMKRSESEKEMFISEYPYIDKNSKEIAKGINGNENVYLRLYEKSKDKGKIIEKINEKIMNERKLKQIKYKNRAYSNIKSKINIKPNSPSQMDGNSKIKKSRTNVRKINFS